MKHIITLLIAITIFTSCNQEKKQDVKQQETVKEESAVINISQAQFTSSKMKLGTLSEQDFSTLVKTTGFIDVPPKSKAVVSAKVGGFVKKANLLIGDKVKKGQFIASIENAEFVTQQQEFLETSEQLTYLKLEYERLKTLYDEKITSQKKYIAAQSKYKSTLAKFNGLKKRLELININPSNVLNGNMISVINLYAPINGVISKIEASKGMYVEPSNLIVEIINTNHIHIELNVFEKDVMKIKKHQKITFKVPEASQEEFEAKVHLVSNMIDEKTRTVKVHGHLEDESKVNFALGMFVEANIKVTNSKALGLPETAIIEDDNRNFVLLLKKQENEHLIFEPIEITVGKKNNKFVKIISDKLKPTDKILIKGGFSLIGS